MSLNGCQNEERKKAAAGSGWSDRKRQKKRQAARSSLTEEEPGRRNLTITDFKAPEPDTAAARARFQASFLARVIELLWLEVQTERSLKR